MRNCSACSCDSRENRERSADPAQLRRARSAGQQSRYRLEEDVPCVDVKASSVEHLFDNRDPAPFRERDLDPGLAAYLLDAGEDLAKREAYRIVFWLEQLSSAVEIEQAFRGHFEDVVARIQRTRRRRRRTGQVTLLLAVVLVVALLMLSQVVARVVPGALGAGLKEGLVISSWVVMWRPVEVLIYDWIPVRRERKVVTKLLEAQVHVRVGRPPEMQSSS